RTEKLSLITPMVLRNSGRVGSRRFFREFIPSGQKTRGDDLFLGDSFILSIFANEYLYKRLKQIFKV
ncbi:hypothetical protein AAH088_13230, partial [Bacteroides hominis]|uniref:hypothetical protein n=1 Tax=Bacteroides hominis TaxID=2763023 RepID=UPI0039C0E1C6